MTGLIWAHNVFCIDIENTAFIHHFYCICTWFLLNVIENKYVPLFYNVSNFFTLLVSWATLSSPAICTLWVRSSFFTNTFFFFLTLISEHLDSFAPLLDFFMPLTHLLCSTASNGCKAQPEIFRTFKRSILIPSSFSNPFETKKVSECSFWRFEIFLVEIYSHYWLWNKKDE